MKGLQGKKILVAGGENCLGGLVARRLKELGASVCSVFDLEHNEKVLGRPEIILYLDHPEILQNNMIDGQFLDVHLGGLLKLLRLAGKQGSHFIYASSSAVYGRQKYLPIDEGHPLDPILLYGAVKMAGECFCRSRSKEEGFFYTILRYGDIYGPGVRIGEPSSFIEGAITRKRLDINGAGDQVRSYLFIDDAVEATIKAVISKPFNQIVNLAGNEYISIWHLANIIKQNYCEKCEIETSTNMLLDELECCVDSVRAKELFNFHPEVDLKTGLFKTYNWFLNQIK